MRRFLSISLVSLALLVGAAGVAPAAHAATPEETCAAQFPNTSSTAYQDCVITAVNDSSGYTGSDTYPANPPADPVAEKTGLDYKPDSTDSAYNTIMIKIMSLFAWLVGVAALTLDYAVYYTVVKMGDYVHNLSAIGVTWRILRDIANIMLIFGFLGAGIATILNVDQYGWKTKMLPMLLVAAVFLNFSLFITEALIDTTNLFATQFYTEINGGVLPTAASLAQTSTETEGISNKIMNKLGLQTLYGQARKADTDLFKGANPWFIGFMGILLFIVTAFVMFALAFILIARFIALIFFIILCPVGFMGLAIPQMKYRAGQWWSNFLEQIITAPVLLLLLYVALAVITDAQFLTVSGSSGTPDWTGTMTGNLMGFASVLLSFLVAMGLLLVVVIKAKNMSAFGAGMATKGAAALTFGATAYGASTLFGGSAFLARKGLQRYAPNNRAVRAISNYALRPLERAKFDIRSAGVGKMLGAMTITDAAAPVGASTVGRGKQGVEFIKKTGQEANKQYDQETRLPRLRAAIAAHDNAVIAQLLGNMSDKELEEGTVQRLLADPSNSAAVASLAQSRFDKLMTSEVLNDAQKNNLRTQRQNGLNVRYADPDIYHNPPTHPTAPGATIPSVRHPGTDMSRGEQAIRALTNEAASQLTDASLVRPEVHENLSIRQLNAIMNAGKIQDTTATTVGNFLRINPTFAAYFAGRNPQQQADLRAFWHI